MAKTLLPVRGPGFNPWSGNQIPHNKGQSGQSYGFPVVMYGCESWTIKKAESRRIDAFEPWCWRRFESPLD